MSARVKLPVCLGSLLKTQLTNAIDEASLSREDALIATRYIIEKVPQIDIAVELNYERSSVSHRMPRIIAAVERAAEMLYQ